MESLGVAARVVSASAVDSGDSADGEETVPCAIRPQLPGCFRVRLTRDVRYCCGGGKAGERKAERQNIRSKEMDRGRKGSKTRIRQENGKQTKNGLHSASKRRRQRGGV